MIYRVQTDKIEKAFFKGKAIIVSGPRQVGKTTMLESILHKYHDEVLILNGDDATVQNLLNRPNTQQIKTMLASNKIIFIDEAQRITDIGLTSKIITDKFKNVQLILSGSSSFDLYSKLNEPLTGRKRTYNIWPITWKEWENHIGYVKAEQDLENRLIFGFYPDVLSNEENPESILIELTESYLYKDVLMYEGLKKPTVIKKLLQALAYQIGSEVSLQELAQTLGIAPKTVDAYIDILEKAYIIFRLSPLSGNLRNEIKAKNKIYFYDNGIRNAVIGQLQPLSIRKDVGILWENFLVSERVKQISINKDLRQFYFWRTTQQQEVDFIEKVNDSYFGYEFKWNEKKKIKFPKTFTNSYKSTDTGINRANFRDFIYLEVKSKKKS
ncbi:MAG: ATP-binding protein [Flavobacteriales bacterium]|nr:ATP-binding protein [Flavobacteriales bacterium]